MKANQIFEMLRANGVAEWNRWRSANTAEPIDLAGADFSELLEPNEPPPSSVDEDDPSWAAWAQKEVNAAVALAGVDFSGADLKGANLSHYIDMSHANLSNADLSGADLSGSHFDKANMNGADIKSANLRQTWLTSADLRSADLRFSDLSGARLLGASLTDAKLNSADLSGACLNEADLSRAHLGGAMLIGTDLSQATLVETRVGRATLRDCLIYGVSVWNLQGSPQEMSNLRITSFHLGEPEVTVDDLMVAQFVYLLLNNENVRSAIDTITSKVVLILGNFSESRKPILEALREELRASDYVPILFDFSKPETLNYQESITLLARMSRFIVADVTDAREVRAELTAIAAELPSVPVRPLRQIDKEEWSTFRANFRNRLSIMPLHEYSSGEALIADIRDAIIVPAEKKLLEMRDG